MEEYLVIYDKLVNREIINSEIKTLIEFHASKELAYKILENCKEEYMYCKIYDAIDITDEFYRGIV